MENINKDIKASIIFKIIKIINEKEIMGAINFNAKLYSENLLGYSLNLRARDLLTLYFEIEKEFKITIPEQDIANGNFNTIENITKIVYKEITK